MSEDLGRLSLDADLIQRYGVHGPRYTSYPTALQFQDDFNEDACRRAVENSNQGPDAGSLMRRSVM